MLHDFCNIENRNALITYECEAFVTDELGCPVMRWGGVTYKKGPITGEDIPGETAHKQLYRYVNPRKAEWPQADYIVENPPFIGAATMCRALGDGYMDAVRRTSPEFADFVVYWWHIAGEATHHGQAKHFRFITTNSIKSPLKYARKPCRSMPLMG